MCFKIFLKITISIVDADTIPCTYRENKTAFVNAYILKCKNNVFRLKKKHPLNYQAYEDYLAIDIVIFVIMIIIAIRALKMRILEFLESPGSEPFTIPSH
jgi:hypothetical protein